MRKCLAALLVASAMASLVGCVDTASPPTGPAPSAAERIKAIQDNPRMPPQTKEAAIAQIRMGEAQGKAAKEDAAKAMK